jgi:Amt family ammonium transporter
MAPIDNLWLMLGGMLVFFMHSGFALLEVGSVSLRNTQVREHLPQLS